MFACMNSGNLRGALIGSMFRCKQKIPSVSQTDVFHTINCETMSAKQKQGRYFFFLRRACSRQVIVVGIEYIQNGDPLKLKAVDTSAPLDVGE